MDNQILRELFSNTIQAARLLKTDEELVQTLAAYQARLMPTTIGPDGRIMEWLEPYEEAEPHHRHVSHLYGLYPANEISPERTPTWPLPHAKHSKRAGMKVPAGRWAGK